MKQEVRRGRKFVEYHDPETQDEFTFTQEISGADVSYQETDGSWHPADENWATDGVDGFVLKNDKLNHKIRLKGNGGRTWYPRRNVNTEYMTFGVPQYRNGNKWSNFRFSGWSVDGKTITLNTRQGVTILVHNRWNGIKIDWVLNNATAPSRMRYPVSLTGITYVGGIIYGADGTRLGQLTPTTATDANEVELVCSGSFANGYVEFQADVTGAVYPVTIDPDFSVTSAAGDTRLLDVSVGPTKNYGAAVELSVGRFGGDYNRHRSLIRFDVSSVENTVTSATLDIYISNATYSYANTIVDVYGITSGNGDWIEGTKSGDIAGSGEPCWNAKEADGSGGVTTAWAGSAGLCTAGTDYVDTVIGYFTMPSTISLNAKVTATISANLINDWIAGNNYGLLLRARTETGSNQGVHFSSSEASTAGYRPTLSITYTTGGALRRINTSSFQQLTGGIHG